MGIDLLFSDWRSIIRDKLGKDPWITVYRCNDNGHDRIGVYCALIPDEMVDEVLSDQCWDMTPGYGFPVYDYIAQEYVRFSAKRDGIEPLIFCREFPGLRESCEEISEEFRHYHNLYHNANHCKYSVVDDVGDEVDVIRYSEDEITIRLKHLREYLWAKKMHLAIYFDLNRHSTDSMRELENEGTPDIVKENKYIYSLVVYENNGKSSSRLLGKKLLAGSENYGPSNRENKEYIDFIVGIDEEGREVSSTCNSEASSYLTRVFFRKEVLGKYYSEPEKFSVEDGIITFGGARSLVIDNNHAEYVIVLLGDLGELPTKEQFYWRSFNIAPEGEISAVAFERQFLGQFADPTRSHLLFKRKFEHLQRRWFKKFDWHLFKPLARNDEHHYVSLRIPLTDDQSEFDQQVLALTKIIIDSLNEAELGKPITKDKGDKGITKLEKYLRHHQLSDLDVHIRFLRNLQDLRAGSAHRKGKQYQRGSEYFRLDKKALGAAFDDVLEQAALFLDYLDEQFLTNSQ